MKILRIFPRKTRATPDDPDVRIGAPTVFDTDVDEIHISVVFTWDIPEAERLYDVWKPYGNVMLGGPALGATGENFLPGQYLKQGYVITSRGCPNKCWFCIAWKREGNIRELPISEGWNVLDNNLLACSSAHIENVFKMLSEQKHPIEFTGGLETKRLTDYHIEMMTHLKIKQAFFAYDTEDDFEPLQNAAQRFFAAGFTQKSRKLRCYVLVGGPNDTPAKAQIRLENTVKAGFMPMAMFYRDYGKKRRIADKNWHDFIYCWTAPIALNRSMREALL